MSPRSMSSKTSFWKTRPLVTQRSVVACYEMGRHGLFRGRLDRGARHGAVSVALQVAHRRACVGRDIGRLPAFGHSTYALGGRRAHFCDRRAGAGASGRPTSGPLLATLSSSNRSCGIRVIALTGNRLSRKELKNQVTVEASLMPIS